MLYFLSGWRLLSREDESHASSIDDVAPPARCSQQSRGEGGLWNHPSLPSGVDTLLIPPPQDGRGEGEGTAQGVLAVLRRFEFDSEVRRMGVVVGEMGEEGVMDLMLLVKGAPER